MLRKSCIALVCLLGLSSCIVTDVTVPLDLDLEETELGTKTGTSTARSLLWIVAWGDAGYAAAAEEGGLKVLRHADQDVFAILGGLYSQTTTVVYGD